MKPQRLRIHCLGLTHHSANVAQREKLAFTPHLLETSLARLGCGNDRTWCDIQELVILSTCNRVELYAVANRPVFEVLEKFLSEVHQADFSKFSPACFRLLDEEAVDHLLRVASGLDSVVLGEPQILGQVTDAYASASRHGTAGKILSRLFQAAIFTGKRSRTETKIGHNPASIASLAVKLISESISDVSTAQIMVLGAGEMAELAVESLQKRGASQIMVVNRTLQRAQELARRWEGQAAALETLPEALPNMDVLITSTGAPHIVVPRSMVEDAMQTRAYRPMVIMDIAVPRDVDADASQVPGVHLYDMDTLSEQLELCLSQRESEIPMVERIVEEEKIAFMDYLATLDVVPIIVGMRKQANSIRQDELEKALRRISQLSPEAQQQIEALTKSIVNKILHIPTVRLREEASGPNAADYADIARKLFGIG